MIDLTSSPVGSILDGVDLAVRSRETRTAKTGAPYDVLDLGNASGSLQCMMWSDYQVAASVGEVLRITGLVEKYADRRQIKLTAKPRKVAPEGIDLGDFVPRVSCAVATLWEGILAWTSSMPLTLLVPLASVFTDGFRGRFEAAPGARRGHHAAIGGLLLHTYEVATIARGAAEAMGGNVDLVTAGALIHDIGKVASYRTTVAGFEHTVEGRLLGHIVLGHLELERALNGRVAPSQATELHHFIASHHGTAEFGAAAQPATLEAELLHWADQASAKGDNVRTALARPFDGEISPRSWELQRDLWRGAEW